MHSLRVLQNIPTLHLIHVMINILIVLVIESNISINILKIWTEVDGIWISWEVQPLSLWQDDCHVTCSSFLSLSAASCDFDFEILEGSCLWFLVRSKERDSSLELTEPKHFLLLQLETLEVLVKWSKHWMSLMMMMLRTFYFDIGHIQNLLGEMIPTSTKTPILVKTIPFYHSWSFSWFLRIEIFSNLNSPHFLKFNKICNFGGFESCKKWIWSSQCKYLSLEYNYPFFKQNYISGTVTLNWTSIAIFFKATVYAETVLKC